MTLAAALMAALFGMVLAALGLLFAAVGQIMMAEVTMFASLMWFVIAIALL